MARTSTTRKATELFPSHPAEPVVQALLVDHLDNFVLAQPSKSYGRIVVGKVASAWLIPAKSGNVRLILRVPADTPVPEKLAEGVKQCDGHDWQLMVSTSNVSQGKQLIKWSHGLLTKRTADHAAESEARGADRKAKRDEEKAAAEKTSQQAEAVVTA